jgi:chorismate lyase/3-hydroxybenzoate synthase
VAVRFDRNTNAHAARGSSSGVASAAGGNAATPLPLRVQYLPTSPSASDQPILAEIGFGTYAIASRTDAHPRAVVALPPLDGQPRREVWTSDLPVRYGERDGLQYAVNEEYLFGVVSENVAIDSAGFEDRVRAIYDNIFTVAESEQRPHLLRMWNYFPAMNLESEGLENYQRFCRSRSVVFQEHYQDFVYRLPSASAIGTLGGAFVVYFIAARTAGAHRENPRQLSAYTYPSQYGPRSPSFARATLKRVGEHETFFISGTASIVGHESLHPGDVRAQAEEALRNIEALIESTRRDEAARFQGMRDLDNLKVYLRRAADLPLVREVIAQRLEPGAHVLYLQGDICRRELLVEIEATLYAG